MHLYLLIALGSALGGAARHACSVWALEKWGNEFPWGTLIINILGSFIIGFFAVLSDPLGRFPVPVQTRLFVMAGICGGFTTFSAFSLQTLDLLQRGEAARAAMNVLLSVSACLLAVWLGQALATLVNTHAHPRH